MGLRIGNFWQRAYEGSGDPGVVVYREEGSPIGNKMRETTKDENDLLNTMLVSLRLRGT